MGYKARMTTWLNPDIEYLFNDEIIEYDIRDAGYSIIKEFRLLPQEEIRRLGTFEKGLPRHKEVGNLQRDNKAFSEALLNKFIQVREVFLNTNNIESERIISVKKDAFFIIGECKRLKFGEVQFAPKHTYSSYVRFSGSNNIEIYYKDDEMDIKGIGEVGQNRHRLYLSEFLRKIIGMIETKDDRTKRYLMKFVQEYKQHELEDEYYLEFNNMSRNLNAYYNYKNIIIPLVQIVSKEMN